MKRIHLIVILSTVAVFLLGILFWWLYGHPSGSIPVLEEKRGAAGAPIDITLDFYESWLSARQSSTTTPSIQDLIKSTTLSSAMSKRLADIEGKPQEDGRDPVLCQYSLPSGLRSKLIFEKDGTAQILVLSKEKESGTQAVITLAAHDELWEITDISCVVTGEQSPNQGEFSFDKEGRLLKASLPPPSDPKYWHLVFEQAGVFGYTAPLFFSDASICLPKGAPERVCTDDMFTETMRVHVQGEMTEAGVQVKRIEFLEQ